MLRFTSHEGYPVNIVETASELPEFAGVKRVYLDAETNGLNSFAGDRAIGWALLRDDETEGWYIPYRHKSPGAKNLDPVCVKKWLADAVSHDWINHNIKFDAHMAMADGAEFGGRLFDTRTLAKLVDSERMQFGLKSLSRDWLGMEMPMVDRMSTYLAELYGRSSKKGKEEHGYEEVPIDLCGEYAVEDVWSNRRLFDFVNTELPSSVRGIYDTEVQLTPVLWDMEHEGLLVYPDELKKAQLEYTYRVITLATRIQEITGREFTDSNTHLQDLFMNQFGLPILAWNEKKTEDGRFVRTGPSFDKDALPLYTIHPDVLADPRKTAFIKSLIAFRKANHHLSTYVKGFQKWMDEDGYIHPDYNQVIRTGRMSASDPNTMGLSGESKKLIHPEEGREFHSEDASQIEFRLIVHFINDQDAIKAYQENPRTDFHTWVAELCGISRHPAKTMNFLMGYGGGKAKATRELSGNPAIMKEIGERVNMMVEAGEIREQDRNAEYKKLCYSRGSAIYTEYHERLPGIKYMASIAQENCRKRGFVFNPFGRRRHLPARVARKAFNACVQGTAMDYIKTRMVALSPRYSSLSREYGIRLKANVHDEILFDAPIGTFAIPAVAQYVTRELEHQPVPFSVPFRWDGGTSATSWKDAIA